MHNLFHHLVLSKSSTNLPVLTGHMHVHAESSVRLNRVAFRDGLLVLALETSSTFTIYTSSTNSGAPRYDNS
jgi:hypothetical protein